MTANLTISNGIAHCVPMYFQHILDPQTIDVEHSSCQILIISSMAATFMPELVTEDVSWGPAESLN